MTDLDALRAGARRGNGGVDLRFLSWVEHEVETVTRHAGGNASTGRPGGSATRAISAV